MKSLWALAVAFFLLTIPGAADELLLTTYYPPPNGEYLNLNILGTLTGNDIAITGNIVGAWLAASSSNPSITLNRSGTVNFSVQASGNTVVGGTLIAGNTNGTGAFSATGNVSFGGNLDMTSGAISNVTTLATSGDASLGGFTTVGNTSIGGNLDMTSGAISNVTTLGTSGNVSIGGNLDMTSGPVNNVTTVTASGKMYSQTTISTDSANTVVTKNYVDAMVSGGAAYKVYGGFMTVVREDGSLLTQRECVWGSGTSSGTCTQGSPRLIALLQDSRGPSEWGGSGAPPTVHGSVYLCVE
jgi:hypothetical protein